MASKVLLELSGPDSTRSSRSALGTLGGHVCARTSVLTQCPPTLSGKSSGRGAVRREAPGNLYHEGPNGSAYHSTYNTATAASSSSISSSQLITGKYCGSTKYSSLSKNISFFLRQRGLASLNRGSRKKCTTTKKSSRRRRSTETIGGPLTVTAGSVTLPSRRRPPSSTSAR